MLRIVITVSLKRLLCVCTYHVCGCSELKSKLYSEPCRCMCSVSVFAKFPSTTHFHVPTHVLSIFLTYLHMKSSGFPDFCLVYNVLCDSLRFFLLWNMNVCAGCLAPVAIHHALDSLLAPSLPYSAPCLSVVDMFEEWPGIHVHVSMMKLIWVFLNLWFIPSKFSILSMLISFAFLFSETFFSPSVCLFS